MTRRLLQHIACWLITVMMVAQFTTAAYACPGMVAMGDAPSAGSVAKAHVMTKGMVIATGKNAATDGALGTALDTPPDTALHTALHTAPDGMQVDAGPVGDLIDAQFGNLCAEHCHQGHQGDHPVLPVMPAVVLSALYVTPAPTVPLVARRPAAATASALAAASASLAVRHCCFRI